MNFNLMNFNLVDVVTHLSLAKREVGQSVPLFEQSWGGMKLFIFKINPFYDQSSNTGVWLLLRLLISLRSLSVAK